MAYVLFIAKTFLIIDILCRHNLVKLVANLGDVAFVGHNIAAIVRGVEQEVWSVPYKLVGNITIRMTGEGNSKVFGGFVVYIYAVNPVVCVPYKQVVVVKLIKDGGYILALKPGYLNLVARWVHYKVVVRASTNRGNPYKDLYATQRWCGWCAVRCTSASTSASLPLPLPAVGAVPPPPPPQDAASVARLNTALARSSFLLLMAKPSF